MSFFEVRSLSAGYRNHTVLRDISFVMEEPCVLGILGENGSGKTTLLRSLASLLPYDGEILFRDEDLKTMTFREKSREFRYIPQRSGLELDLSVLDVVLMGFNPYLKLLAYPGEKEKAEALAALCDVGMQDKAGDNFRELSEGQKQLCLLARTMVGESRMWFLDEPESALDFFGRYALMDRIVSGSRQKGYGVAVTLHDPQLALNCCDRLLLLHEGRCITLLSPRDDTRETMERYMRELYGSVSIQSVPNRSGCDQYVLLREGESRTYE